MAKKAVIMQTFDFKIDKKITTWERSHYSIQAETREQAMEIAKKEFEDQTCDDEAGFINCETLYDCNEYLTPEDNGTQFTEELNFEDETILTNLEKTEA